MAKRKIDQQTQKEIIGLMAEMTSYLKDRLGETINLSVVTAMAVFESEMLRAIDLYEDE